MFGVRRGIATRTHVWPAIPGLPGQPLRGLSGPATAQTGVQSRIILSGAPAGHMSLDVPVKERGGSCYLIRPG